MMDKITLCTLALLATILISSVITPVFAAPSSGEKDNACNKSKNPKSNAPNAVGCGDADNDGKLDRYDSAPYDPCIPNNTVAACDSDDDGVVNGNDLCPDTPLGAIVDKTGCSLYTDVSITKTTPVELIEYGIPFEYIINVNVVGNPARNVHVTDLVHPDLSLVEFSALGASCTLSNNYAGFSEIDCVWSSVEEGSPKQLRISVVAHPTTDGAYTNVARVQTETPEINQHNNQAGVVNLVSGFTGATDLAITKTGPKYASVGDSITYEIITRNISLFESVDVVITDTLPAGVIFSVGDTYTEEGVLINSCRQIINHISCDALSIQPNTFVRTLIHVRIAESFVDSITNTVEVSTRSLEINLNDNTAEFTTVINP